MGSVGLLISPGERRRARAALVGAGLGTMMLTLDSTIVTVALPAIQRTFGATLTVLQLVLILYLIAQGVLLLLTGFLADRFGRRRVFLYGLGVFAVSSLLCALAPSISFLIAARAVQGAASAVLLAAGVALLNAETPSALRPRAFGIWGGIFGVGIALGPILGGALVTFAGWPWIFLVNLPVAAVAIGVTAHGTEESREPAPRPGDHTGIALFVALVLSALLSVQLGPIGLGGEGATWGLTAATLVFAVAFVLWELRAPAPVFDLGLFRRRGFLLGALGAVTIALTYWVVFLYFPMYFEEFLGYSALAAGLALLPIAIPFALLSVFGGRWVGRVSSGSLFATGLAVTAVGTLWLLVPGAGAAWWAFSGGLALVGAGTGLYQAEITRLAVASAPDDRAGVAGGMNLTLRAVAVSFGWAAMGVLFAGEVSSSFLAQTAGTALSVPALNGAVADQIAVGDFAGGWNLLLAHGVSPMLYPTYLAIAQSSYFSALHLVLFSGVVVAGVGAAISVLLGRGLRPSRSAGGSEANAPRADSPSRAR